ncbi:MAG TPA: AAA domain-containing protein [Chloroflexia bacterium]|nr:AAA domain-containing protein [Chloroflexia bacterium]
MTLVAASSTIQSPITFSDYVFNFAQALESEIRVALKNKGQKAYLSDGRHIGRRGKWELYSFNSDREITLPDDIEVQVECQGKEYVGNIISNDGFIIVLGLEVYLGDTISTLIMQISPIFLLQKLQERLGEARFRQANPNNLAYRLLQRLDLSEYNPAEAAQVDQLLEKISWRLGKSLEYNEDQRQAVASVLGRDISFIWGPPGTGKTKTLGMAVAALVEAGQSVLVVTHSNAAVDVALLSIAPNVVGSEAYEEGSILRFGIIRNKELQKEYPNVHVRGVVERQNPQIIAELNKLEAERKEVSNKTRREGLGAAEKSILTRNLNRIQDRLKEITTELQQRELELVKKAQVVACTLSKMTIASEVYERTFDAVVIDEASMALIPHCVLAATLAAKRVAIFGDFRQLAPIAQSDEPPAKEWLHRDIFNQAGIVERVRQNQPDSRLVMLRTQYRMHPAISAIPNHFFYNSKLLDGPQTASRAEKIVESEPVPGQPIALYDTSKMLSYCFSDWQSKSRFNPLSALIAVNEAYRIAQKSEQKQVSLGIITPYAAQSRLINKMLRDLKLSERGVKVATVHRFQGSEQDHIIFDAVESPPKNKAGKLVIGEMGSTAMRLINVAISRAKGKFIGIVQRDYLKTVLNETDVFGRVVEQLANIYPPQALSWPTNKATAKWQLDLPGVTYYPDSKSPAKFLETDLLKARGEIAVYWPSDVKAREFFNISIIKKRDAERIRTFISGPGRNEFKIGIQNVDFRPTHLQTGMCMVGIDRDILWIYLNPKNPSYPVLRIFMPDTVRLLYNFWELLPEDQGKSILDKIAAGQSPVGNPCLKCGSPMWLDEGPFGLFLRCTNYECNATKNMTAKDAEALAQVQGIYCRKCGGQVRGVKSDQKWFLGCKNYPECKEITPLRA